MIAPLKDADRPGSSLVESGKVVDGSGPVSGSALTCRRLPR